MNPNIVFFDLEGTLLKKAYHLDDGIVAPSAWTLLAESLGERALKEENVTKEKKKNDEYKNYFEWMEDTIRIHNKYGLTKSKFVQVLNSVEQMDGCEELFSWLHEIKAITVVITGGFKYLTDKIQAQYKIDHAFSACEYFFDPETEKLCHWNLLPADEKGKVDFLKLIVSEHKTDINNCVFIGDGKNDVYIAKTVGFSIAFNAQEELNKVASVKIDQGIGNENLSAAINIIKSR